MKFRIQIIYYNYDTDFSESSVYLSKSAIDLLKLEQGDYIDLNLYTNDDKLIKSRKSRLICLEDANVDFNYSKDYKTEDIYLSSVLWFNLTNDDQQFDFNYATDRFYIEVSDLRLYFEASI